MSLPVYVNSNLSFDERERIAYANGESSQASIFAQAAEFEDIANGQDDLIDKERKEAYEEGKVVGQGERITKVKEDMRIVQMTNSDLYQRNVRLLDLVRDFDKYFYDKRMKSIAGRKEIQKEIQQRSR